MGLGDLFKRLSKGSEREKKAEAEPTRKGGKVLPPVPAYLKKDKFIRNPGQVSPAPPDFPSPGDMAEAGAFKQPGKWLKPRLGGVTDSQAIDNIEKTKVALKKSGGLNDQEIQSFLDGLLEGDAKQDAAVAQPSSQGLKAPNLPNPFPENRLAIRMALLLRSASQKRIGL